MDDGMPTYTTLITAQQLQALLQTPSAHTVIFDCSFDLAQPQAGAQQYAQAHLPGAWYADVNQDLSHHGQHGTPASAGRHPLPSREAFAQWLGERGVTHDTQVVVYDRQNANYCGRLWWMLQWVGHAHVAVLDGGLAGWQAAGGATDSGAPSAAHTTHSHFALQPALQTLVTADEVLAQLGQPAQTIIDARAAPRFRGEVEPLDPVAGHIPGALNRPFSSNLDSNGFFRPASALRAEFETLLAGRDPNTVVHQCGSGVSAIPNLLAMRIAGFEPTRLFAGSWSEWCSNPARPVEKG